MVANQDKLGLYKRMKIEKIKKELEEIQSNGKESIILITKKLIKELRDQGYDTDGAFSTAYISIFEHDTTIQVRGHKLEVEGEK